MGALSHTFAFPNLGMAVCNVLPALVASLLRKKARLMKRRACERVDEIRS